MDVINKILKKKDSASMNKAYGLNFDPKTNNYQVITLRFDMETGASEVVAVEDVGGIEALAVRKAQEKMVRDLFKLGDK